MDLMPEFNPYCEINSLPADLNDSIVFGDFIQSVRDNRWILRTTKNELAKIPEYSTGLREKYENEIAKIPAILEAQEKTLCEMMGLRRLSDNHLRDAARLHYWQCELRALTIETLPATADRPAHVAPPSGKPAIAYLAVVREQAGKTVVVKDGRVVDKIAEDTPRTNYQAHIQHGVADLIDLRKVLMGARADDYYFVRGILHPRYNGATGCARRARIPKDGGRFGPLGEPGYLSGARNRLVVFDLDNLKVGAASVDLQDPQSVWSVLAPYLPPEVSQTDRMIAPTTGFGKEEDGKVSVNARVWCFAEEPVGYRDLKAWWPGAKSKQPGSDPASFRPVQPCYLSRNAVSIKEDGSYVRAVDPHADLWGVILKGEQRFVHVPVLPGDPDDAEKSPKARRADRQLKAALADLDGKPAEQPDDWDDWDDGDGDDVDGRGVDLKKALSITVREPKEGEGPDLTRLEDLRRVFGFPGAVVGALDRVEVEGWRASSRRVVKELVCGGYSNAEIFAAARLMTCDGYSHAETLKEVASAIAWARSKYGNHFEVESDDEEENIGPEGEVIEVEPRYMLEDAEAVIQRAAGGFLIVAADAVGAAKRLGVGYRARVFRPIGRSFQDEPLEDDLEIDESDARPPANPTNRMEIEA